MYRKLSVINQKFNQSEMKLLPKINQIVYGAKIWDRVKTLILVVINKVRATLINKFNLDANPKKLLIFLKRRNSDK